jgi:hypothetical protein
MRDRIGRALPVSGLDLIGLFIICWVVAWAYSKICSDIISRPRRLSREESARMRGWWFYDGYRWHRRKERDVRDG